MTIFKTIQSKLAKSAKSEVAKELGYHSQKKGIEAIDKFLHCKTLTEWILHGFYDFKFGADELYSELCRLYEISEASINRSINVVKLRERALYKCRGASIFAKIPKEEVHINSMAQAYAYAWRYPSIDPKLLIFKNIKEVLAMISQIIKTHYNKAVAKKRRGADKVEMYEYHHYDDTIYLFNTAGELL